VRFPLDIPSGLVFGEAVLAAQGRYTDGSLVRFVSTDNDQPARPETIGGWEALTFDQLGGVCRNTFTWTDLSGRLNIAFGTHTGLYVWRGGALFNITPTGLAAGLINGTEGQGYGAGLYGGGFYGQPTSGAYYARTWSFGALGETLIACPRGGKIYQWSNNTGTVAAQVTNAPTTVTSILVTEERAIMAIGCNEEVSGTFNPLCIRHSSVTDETVWTTSTTSTAREKVLAGGGRLVGGLKVASSNIVYTGNQAFVVSYIGALDEVYRFESIGNQCGLLGANSMTADNQTAYWLSPDYQLWGYSLGGVPQTLTTPFSSDLSDYLTVSQQDKVIVSTVKAFNELWIFYPDKRDGIENSRAFSLNLKHGSPSKHILSRTAFIDASVARSPIGVTSGGQIYWHERGNSADGAALTGYLISGAQYLAPGGELVSISSIWPDFKGQRGAINLTLLCREQPQDEPVEVGPYTILPSQSKQDLHTVARLIGLKLSFSSGPAYMRMGTPIVEGRIAGRR
jgi:hypothetical protein